MKSSIIKGDRPTALEYEQYFKGKVCLLTGATGGIGRCVCRKLLRAGNMEIVMLGAYVIMVGRTAQKVDALYMELKKEGLINGDCVMPKSMDFNEPANVEKDFQNVETCFYILIVHAED